MSKFYPEITNEAPDLYFSIVVPDGSTIRIGQTLNDYDSSNIAFYGSCDNRTRVACFDDDDYTLVTWANNTGSDQTFIGFKMVTTLMKAFHTRVVSDSLQFSYGRI